MYLLLDVLIGAAAGLIAGLLGTGNSLVVLPALIFIFNAKMHVHFSIDYANCIGHYPITLFTLPLSNGEPRAP
jgi:uncharacterized membrane protein YfcA